MTWSELYERARKRRDAAAGYYNDAAKTAKTFREINGVWCVIPGDYGRIEADGSLTLLGRGSTVASRTVWGTD